MAWNARGRNFWIGLDLTAHSLQHGRMKGKRKWLRRLALPVSIAASIGMTTVAAHAAQALATYWYAGGGRMDAFSKSLGSSAAIWTASSAGNKRLRTWDHSVQKLASGLSHKNGDRFHSLMAKWDLATTMTCQRMAVIVTGPDFPPLANSLKALPELEHLSLESKIDVPPEETGRLYTTLGEMKNLKSLSIHLLPPGFANARKLQGHPHLESISLPVSWFQPEYLAVLRSMPRLRALRVTQTPESFEPLLREKAIQTLPGVTVSAYNPEWSICPGRGLDWPASDVWADISFPEH